MSESVIEINSENEFNGFVKEGTVLVDFFAEWCMPCVMMAPILDELSEKFNGKIKFGKVNINDNEELSQKFEVSSIPNFVLFRDGKVAERFVGSMTEEEFEARLNGFLN
ncbi:MAG: thioredoxin [Nanoarchaeota archaeon]|nr:thioredoxin [Nanoarchaeota archaeon]